MESAAKEALIAEIPAVAPLDEYNERLVADVHPTDWVNPEPDGRYNLVVLGAGTAGLVTAAGAAGVGAKVALIERSLLGGDCLNVGCVPSKALIRSARAAADVRDAAEFGVDVPAGVRVDFGRVMERLRRLRSEISRNDSARRFRGLGIDVFIGSASFSGPDTVEVAGKTLRFTRAVIATGARPVVPPVPGIEDANVLTNETLFTLTELPRRFGIIGAGPIGCEMAQSFARFGSEVHLIEKAGQVLVREDRDAARIVEAALARDGVTIHSGTTLAEVRRSGDDDVLVLDRDGEREELTVDAILMSVGRAPNVEGLNLEGVGVEYDRSGVKVDDTLRTTNPRIFAAGDVCFAYKFTHTADALARIVIRNALFFGRARASALTIPWCTFTSPEIAHVGLYEKQAREAGHEVETIQIPLQEVDRAKLEGETGLLKVHLKKGTDKILGATLVARHAGDMISEVTVAMMAGAGLKTFAETIHPYPTQAEVLKRAGDTFNRGRLTPFVKRMFERLLAWRR